MPSIDERIVQMRFDNRQFEEGVSQSMSTLDKLKSALAFDSTVGNIQKLGNAIGGLTFSPLQNGIDQVVDKFSLLQYMGLKVMTDLANSAVSTGERMVKSLSIDQVMSGWNKYADKTQSVQTIISATGMSVEEVSEQLDRLNWFTDETSYNFVDMVNNIGKFTNNKIPLQEAVTSMEGIATWAGSAGANVGEASRAMYNLAQAVSVGSVKLMDWRSIENANMATSEFKNTAIEAALALGKLEKTKEEGIFHVKGQKAESKVSVQDFNSELSTEWFSKDVLIQALSQYGNFTNALNNAINETGIDTTSELLDYLDQFREGSLDLKELTKEYGVSTDRLKEIFTELSTDVSFTDALDQAMDLTKMQDHKDIFLGYLEEYNNGIKTAQEISEEIAKNDKLANVSAENLEKAFDIMNHSGFALGEKAFRMAQEAKTFQEAIDATQDAVSTAWMNFFEIIFGNYEQAKRLWTDLANEMWDVFAGPVNELNEVARMWAQGIYDDEGEDIEVAGRREKAIEAVYTAYGKLKDLISEGFGALMLGFFGDIDGVDVAKKLISITDAIHDFVDNFEVSDTVLSNFKVGLEAVGRIAKFVVDIYITFAKVIFNTLGALSPFVELLSKWVRALGNLVIYIDDAIQKSDIFNFAIEKIASAVSIVIDYFLGFLDVVGKWTGINWNFLDANDHDQLITLLGFFDKLRHWIEDLTGIKLPTFSGFLEGFKSLFEVSDLDMHFLDSDDFTIRTMGMYEIIKGFIDKILELVGLDLKLPTWQSLVDIFTKIKETLSPFNDILGSVTEGFSKLVETISNIKPLEVLGNIFTTVWNAIKSAGATLAPIFQSLFSSISQFFGGIKESIGEFSVDRFINMVMGIFTVLTANSIWSAADKITEFFDHTGGIVKRIYEFVENISEAGDKAAGAKGIGEYLGDFIGGIKDSLAEGANTIEALRQFAISIGILVAAVFILATIDPERLNSALKGITTLLFAMFGTLAAYVKNVDGNADDIAKLSTSFIKIGAAILILSMAVAKLSTLSIDQLIMGLSGMAVILVAIYIFASQISKGEGSKGITKDQVSGVLKLAIAVNLLARVVTNLSTLSSDQLFNGLAGLAGVLAELYGFIWLISKTGADKFNAGQALALLIVAGAIMMLQKPITYFGSMDWKQLALGLGAVGAILLEFGIFATLVGKAKGGMIRASIGMLVMSVALEKIFECIKTLADVSDPNVISNGLVLITMLLLEFGIFANVVKGSNALAASASILILAVALNKLIIPLTTFGAMNLTTMAKSLGMLAGILTILGVAGVLLAPVAPYMLMISGSVLLLGVGLMALGTGMAVFGAALPKFAVRLLATIGIVIAGLIAMLPMIGSFALSMITVFITTILGSLTQIVNAAVQLVAAVCQGIITAAPLVIQAGIWLLLSFVLGLIENMDIITAAAVLLVVTFVNGFVNAFRDNSNLIIGVFGNLISAILEFAISALQSFVAMIPGVGDTLANQLEGWKQSVRDNLISEDLEADAEQAKQSLRAKFDEMSSTTKEQMGGMASGLINPEEYGSAGEQNGVSFNDGLIRALNSSEEGSVGQNIAQGISDGLLGNEYLATDAAGTLGTDIMAKLQETTGVHSPSTIGIETGMHIDEGLAQGITDNKYLVVDAINSSFGNVLDETIGQNVTNTQVGSTMANSVNSGFDAAMKSSMIIRTALNKQGILGVMAYVKGMRSKLSNVKTMGRSVSNAGTTGIRSKNNDWFISGQNAVAGFVRGMNSRINSAARTAASVARAAKNAAARALEEQSPSKAFFRIGAYADQGLINGMLYLKDEVADASESVAVGSLDMMAMALDRIASTVSDDYELNPTITPIFDMSNIEDGFSTINKYASRKYAVSAGIGGATSMRNAYAYSGSAGTIQTIGGVPTSNHYNITINAPTGNARDIAREVERIIVRR